MGAPPKNPNIILIQNGRTVEQQAPFEIHYTNKKYKNQKINKIKYRPLKTKE